MELNTHLLFLSNTSTRLARQVSDNSCLHRATLGGSVAVAGTIAFCNSALVGYTIADTLWVALPIGTVVGTGVVLLEKALIANKKKGRPIRALVAIVFSTVFTYFGMLYALNDDITEQIQNDYAKQNVVIQSSFNELIAHYNRDRKLKSNEIEQTKTEIFEYKRLRDAERTGFSLNLRGESNTGVIGQGIRWKQLNAQYLLLEQHLNNLQKEALEREANFIADTTKAGAAYRTLAKTPQFSILNRSKAYLYLLSNPDPEVASATLKTTFSLWVLLFMLEILPLVISFLLPLTDLDKKEDEIQEVAASLLDYLTATIKEAAKQIAEDPKILLNEKINKFIELLRKAHSNSDTKGNDTKKGGQNG